MREVAATADAAGLPRRFGFLPGYGMPGIDRRPWKRPAQAAAPVYGCCCECMDEAPGRAWDEAVAPYILQEPEWQFWRRLPRAAARRRWMRGRVAAKDAVRLLMLERLHLAASLETIGILPDEHGQPQVTCAALPDLGAGIFVSISHCGNRSVALAAERSEFCRGVGIDVASHADPHEGLAEGGFAPAETALLEAYPAAERAGWLLWLWCAKEAVGKALGVGLMGDPLNYRVGRIHRTRRVVDIEARLGPERAASAGATLRLAAHVGCEREMAYAVARLEGL